ncbi:MAG: hypothetical protein BYD32DRAFT_369099 [Podila humilis]|nr:MAG: hypothetical protein BYD32DRAFT_369099 [Podila humilis]
MSDKISNTLKSTLGGAKESLGKAVGSEQLMASAQADARTVAQRAQQEQEMAGQRVQGAADEVTGRTKSTLGAAAGNTKMQVEGNLQETSGTARKTMNK